MKPRHITPLLFAFCAACAVSEPEPSGPCDNDGDCIVSERCVDQICTRQNTEGASCEDADGDGFGVGETSECSACLQRGLCAEDCNDGDAAQNPGVIERCDGVDNDCDQEVDEPQECEVAAECVDEGSLLPSCSDGLCLYLPPNQDAPGCTAEVACFEGARTASPACL